MAARVGSLWGEDTKQVAQPMLTWWLFVTKDYLKDEVVEGGTV